MQACKGLNTGLIDQINAGILPNMHHIKLWRTAQDEPGFEFDSQANWFKDLNQLAICMEPEKAHPTVLIYMNSEEGITFALTLSLTNNCHLIIFTINNITN